MSNKELRRQVAKLASTAAMVDMLYNEKQLNHGQSISPSHYETDKSHNENIRIVEQYYKSLGDKAEQKYVDEIENILTDPVKGKAAAANMVRKILMGGSQYESVLLKELEAHMLMAGHL